jgi:hypothetical protein
MVGEVELGIVLTKQLEHSLQKNVSLDKIQNTHIDGQLGTKESLNPETAAAVNSSLSCCLDQ